MKPDKRIEYDGHSITECRYSIVEFINFIAENEIKSHHSLIDIGAGDWYYPRKMFKPICNYFAQDVYEAKDLEGNTQVDFVGSLEDLNATFNLATCFDVLEHVKNPDQFIRSIYNVLDEEGRLYLTTPFNFWIHASGEKGFYDYWRFTEQGLRLILERNNFKIVRLTHFGEEKYPVSYQVIAEKV